jgi:hypothetical protein
MRRVYAIIGFAAGTLVVGAAVVAGLSAASSPWTRRSATIDSRPASGDSRPESVDPGRVSADSRPVSANPQVARQSLAAPAWQIYALQYGIVGVAADPNVSQAAVTSPDDRSWYLHFVANILLPGEAMGFRLTALEPASGETPESSAPVDSTIYAPPMPRSRRSANDPDRVLNDGQLASIKARLKLTPVQEGMWPPVEAALRKVTYVRPTKGSRQKGFIDFDGPEVQQLVSAAQPLMKRLSEDQRREVRSLAHVMGLDVVAALF